MNKPLLVDVQDALTKDAPLKAVLVDGEVVEVKMGAVDPNEDEKAIPVGLNEQLDPNDLPAIIIYRSGSETVKTFSATVRTGEIVGIECRAEKVETALLLEDAVLNALNALNASGRLRLRNEFTSQTDFSPDLGIHRAALSVTIKT